MEETHQTFKVENGGGINLFRIDSYRSICNEHKTINPLEKNCEELWTGEVEDLHVDGGWSVSLRFSNMKNKGYCHVILHLVHNPTH